MHGVALTMLMSKKTRAFSALIAKQKDFEKINLENTKTWNRWESLSYAERIGVGVLARYFRVS